MGARFRSIRVLAVLALVAASTIGVVASSSASAAVTPLQIGVDHPGPAGHNYEYKDFFPRGDAASPVDVAAGGLVQFNWPQTPDGFHTATLLATTTDPATAWDAPLTVPDPDDSAGQLQFNPALAAPSNPPAGSGAPGACGDVATPCPYDGSSELSSGANLNDGTSSFVVQIGRNLTPGTRINYACLIHRGMAASLTVVDPAGPSTTQPQADAESAAQLSADNVEATAAEAAANVVTSTANPDGTHTFQASAGTETTHTAVLEMLPSPLPVSAGDKVDWHMTDAMAEIHTVTFIDDPKFEPLVPVCEGDPGTDTLLDPNAPPPPCGDPSLFEQHVNPAPGGGTVISSPTTSASSGILFPPGPPLPHDYTFSFPAAGTFPYFCHIHANGMTGSVQVLAVAVAATPAPTQAAFTG